MSYETNPILNRIKILKGWKNPTFPTKTLNYSREIVLWFKVYLFLKVFLWCQNIRLLTCEVRTSEVQTKILYLSISKHIPRKKNAKSKWKTKSFLQNLKSSLTKTQNKKARFLLYRDLRTLKQQSEFFFNVQKKKKISKIWISKGRTSSWSNFAQILYRRRNFYRQQQIISWRKKQKISFSKKQFLGTKKESLTVLLDKRQRLQKKTQKNILALLIKFQKDILFLEKILDNLSPENFKSSQNVWSALQVQLIKEYRTKLFFLEKVKNLYRVSLQKEEKRKETKLGLNFFSNRWATHLFQQKINKQYGRFLLFLKKEWTFFEKKLVFFFSKKKQLSFSKKNFWKKTFIRFLTASVKNITIQKREGEHFLFAQMYNILCARHFESTLLIPKILAFKKPVKLRGWQLFRFLRFEQKKKLHTYAKFKPAFRRNDFVPKEKITSKIQKLSYRLSFRYNYRNHLALASDLKLKYLISDLIQEYFAVAVHLKLLWPLKSFKSLKFYRLIFPAYQQFNLKKKNYRWDLNQALRLQNKRYFYVGQNTESLKMKDETLFLSKKKDIYGELYSRHLFLNSSSSNSNSQKTFVLTKTQQTKELNKHQPVLKSLSGVWKNKLKKKNKYLVLKKKIIQAQSEKRLFWASKQSFISNLIVTLTLFAKYLEVQPLADHLAKIIGDTKKHATTLKVIKTVLRTLRFRRGVGYRIALIGRINGAKKSRTIYLKKLNRNRSRQTFSKNVNFAMAQARATIGAFGVKVWVYF